MTIGSDKRSASWTIALGAAWLAAGVWVALRLDQGWVPHDDGSFAQSAQRVLDGQLPHREFAELYSGGLTFLNAGMFWLFGENLIWLRLPLFVLFLAFVPCFYAIARRFVGRPPALLVTAFAVAWSVPVYPAAVPSWYLLFLSVFGTYCTIRYFEGGRAWWLFAAGLCGGLALGVKIVGVWFVVAVLVGLTASEQAAHRRANGHRRRVGGYGLLLFLGALVVVALLLAVLGSHLGRAEIVTFVVPVMALCCIPIVFEQSLDDPPAWPRIRSLCRRVIPFLLGVATPLVVLALPYVVVGAVPDLLDGVLVAPRARLDASYLGVPGPTALLWGAPVLGAMLVRHYVPRARWLVDALAVAVVAVLLLTVDQARSYLALWHVIRALGPYVLVAGALMLALRPGLGAEPTRRLSLLLVLLVAGMGSLIQFPFAAPVYFCYAAPLFALAAVAVVGTARPGGGALPTALLVGFTLFGLVIVDRQSINTLGIGFERDAQTVILDSGRASIRVTPSDRDLYRTAATLLESHASGEFAFAGPDAPELYFLAQRKNPTRSLFDFLDTSNSARGEKLLRELRERNVTAVAINLEPGFSQPLGPAISRRLSVLYPQHSRVGKFDIRWRSAD